uniref:Uncharacterized protein n=1 Tax=Arundo donax TaxID=35708 RepID=A0A0A9HHW4_ARUDO
MIMTHHIVKRKTMRADCPTASKMNICILNMRQ